MKGLVRVIAAATMTLGAASVAQAQTLPAASDIVAKHVAAIGGRDAILKIKSISQKQTTEVPSAGLSAETESMAAAPNMMVQKTSIPGVGDMISGFDGTVGWDINPMQGPRLMSGKELQQQKENSDFHDSRLFPADKYSKMETLAQVDFNGGPTYKVRMIRTSGDTVTHYFSTTSGLLVGTEASQETAMGTNMVQAKFSEYEAVDGVKFAKRTEMQMGPMVLITTVKSTTLNTVPASAFEIPAAVKPLIGK